MRAIFLACYAPDAMMGLISGSDPKAAIEALLNSVGGKLDSMMFTRGEFDVAVICDLPDQSTGRDLAMAIQASGAMTRITILEELEMGPVIAAAQRAARGHEPAGEYTKKADRLLGGAVTCTSCMLRDTPDAGAAHTK
jgi:uncharacterized protein with GYD domain